MSFVAALADLASAEIAADGTSLSAALLFHDRYTARLACAAAEFERDGEWAIAGFTSAIAWLRDQGLTPRDAALLLRLGRRMLELPVTAAAWLDGRLRGGQVQAICAQVIDRHLPLFQEQEPELIESFAALSVDGTIQVMGVWRSHADAINEGPEPTDERCEAKLSPTLDNRGLLSASLDAEGYGLAVTARGLADSNDLDTSAPERRGQALKDIFRFFLDNQNRKSGGRHRPHLNIVVNAETLGTSNVEGYDAVTGMTLAPETIQRLMCDCDMHRVLQSASAVLDYGRTTKTPPRDLYNAVVLRDRHCRFPGCDRPALWCHAHHVDWFGRDFGKTSLDNLVLLCSRHHTMIHRRGWSARLLKNGDFEVTDPNGRIRTSQPPGAVQLAIPDRWREYDDAFDPFAAHLDTAAARVVVLARLAAYKETLAA